MSRSVVRLILATLATAAVVVFIVVNAYARTMAWDAEDARREGLLWVYGAVDAAAPEARAALVDELQAHVLLPVRLVTQDELTRRAGALAPGGQAFVIEERRQAWAYFRFEDGRGGLVAGPADPVVPVGVFPIGMLLLLVMCPLIAVVVGLRISRQLARIEAASQAFGAGNLKARVDGPRGPSWELAETFNEMAERIERLVRDRDELLQAVSHELGSPLARLRLQLELLTEDGRELPAARVDAMAEQVDELDQLVEDLLRWVQTDAADARREAFDAVAPLAHLAELAQLEGPRDSPVTIEVDAPDAARLVADPRQYQRAVDNLLRNAQRYARSKVRLRLVESETHVVVTVEDDGPGIPAEARARVLEPFSRLDKDRGRAAGGVGLGLAIVQRILQSHQGTVTVGEAELGGAKLTLAWPRAAAPTASSASSRAVRA